MLAPGETFEGKYKIKRLLGRGGMGAVYEVEHVRVPGRYALKTMLPELGADENFRERFFREIEIARGLIHTNVITIRDCDVAGNGSCYYTMDLSPGVALTKLIPASGMEWRRALALIRQVFLALGEAHRRGIVHRDIKPDNVLVEGNPPSEVAKVLDFGIARAIQEDDSRKTLTSHGIVGTPAYMPPEQALGKKVDGRADIYSTGVVLHRLLTGELPFRSETPTGYYAQHITQTPPPIRKVRPQNGFSDALERFVLRTLEKEAEDRFPTCEEAIDAIDALLGFTPRGATPTPSSSARPVAIPSGQLDRGRLSISGPAGGTPLKMFVFAVERASFGRARPKSTSPDENAVVLWLLPARSEQQDPENWRATLEVSGKHFEIAFREGGAWITDRSTRGTLLNGEPLPKGEARRLPAEKFKLEVGRVLQLEGHGLGAGGAAR
jgi:serine/threonine protein kinase